MDTLKRAIEEKKEPRKRQAALFAYGAAPCPLPTYAHALEQCVWMYDTHTHTLSLSVSVSLCASRMSWPRLFAYCL
jgi:hypothetical protein